MEVLLKIPPEVERYIQYIPEEALSSILIDLVREGILDRSTIQQKAQANPAVSMENILDLIKSGLGTSQLSNLSQVDQKQPVTNVVEEIATSEVASVNIKETISRVIIDDDDDDLDDIMGLLK